MIPANHNNVHWIIAVIIFAFCLYCLLALFVGGLLRRNQGPEVTEPEDLIDRKRELSRQMADNIANEIRKRACPKCKDVMVRRGEVEQLTWMECERCGHVEPMFTQEEINAKGKQ